MPAKGDLKFITLLHPKSGNAQYIVAGDRLLELQKMRGSHSSWFKDNNVIEGALACSVMRCNNISYFLRWHTLFGHSHRSVVRDDPSSREEQKGIRLIFGIK